MILAKGSKRHNLVYTLGYRVCRTNLATVMTTQFEFEQDLYAGLIWLTPLVRRVIIPLMSNYEL